ncbi:MAG: Na(+)/H(+) antiporter subunit D [Alphaproteobacteria bacterium MarineAlpha4_Bin2]|nr:MAG: Na(+)/H(+) antiporter subunit D [Alphaproteobacteria bacterium MarineAlpha4_Bin2]
MIATNLPALQVVIPLLCAPFCLLLRWNWYVYGVALVASWCAFAVSVALLDAVLAGGPISYRLGGWAPPWGIEYVVDSVNAYVLLIVSTIGALVITFGKQSVERELPLGKDGLFYTSYLLCLAGLLGVTITGDAFNIFVFLEISSLSSYILISLGRQPMALTAAYRYLVLGTIGATFYLIGVGLLYQATGTLNIADLAARVADVGESRSVRVAFGFMTVGLGIKLALFPLHIWLPNAYAYAPSVSSAFLAATATKVSVYVLVRVFFTIFGPAYSFETMWLDLVLLPLAIAAMFVGSLVAIFQVDVKRMLAYSSVAQIGYMIVGISLASVLGLTGGLLHLFNHALMKGALFLAMGCVFYRLGSVLLEDLSGLGHRMPWTMAAFVVGGLSLIGVPLTAGFVSKWYLILGAIDKDWWWLAAFILFSSLLAIIYVWRIIEVAYLRPAPDGTEVQEAPLSLLIPTWILALANIYFGIDTRVSVGVAETAASFLMVAR